MASAALRAFVAALAVVVILGGIITAPLLIGLVLLAVGWYALLAALAPRGFWRGWEIGSRCAAGDSAACEELKRLIEEAQRRRGRNVY